MSDPELQSFIEMLRVILMINSVISGGAVIVGYRIVRHLARMEMRIAIMWKHFKRTVLHDDSDDELT